MSRIYSRFSLALRQILGYNRERPSMSCIFFASDHHFGHNNILRFQRNDGTLLRPGFSNIEEMDEHLIERWNKVVRPQDKVYHCGDFTMRDTCLSYVKRLNGHKRLILGNHDKFPVKRYVEAGFEEVYGSRQFEGIICTHIPIHPGSMSRWKINVHGHLHFGQVTHPIIVGGHIDERYRNVSVEMLKDYKPISLEEIRSSV